MIFQYVKDIIKHTSNIFSIFTIFLCIAAFVFAFFFPGKNDLIDYKVGLFFLALSFVSSNYFAWKALYKRFLGDLTIVPSTKKIQPGFIGNGNVSENKNFRFEFDVSNSTNRSYFLKAYDIKITEFDDELLFFDDPIKLIIYENSNSNYPISTPFEISSKSKKLLIGEIPVKFLSNGPESFAIKVNKIKKFSVIIKLYFEDLNRITHDEVFEFTDDFGHFRNHAMNHWKKNKKFEKLYLISNQKENV